MSHVARALTAGFSIACLLAVGGCGSTPGVDERDSGGQPGVDAAGEDAGGLPGQDAGTTGMDAATPPTDTGPRPDTGPWQASCRTLTFPTITVPPGRENTECVIVDLGNDQPMHIGQIHNHLGEGSHHFIVYRASASATLQETPSDCAPFVDTLSSDSGSPLMITQRQDETLQLPPGVGYTVPAHQLIRLELHYINVTGAPLDVAPTSELCPLADADFTDEADFLFVGDPDINIAPHARETLGPVFYRLDNRFAHANFFAITGHTHQWGRNVVVSTAPSATGATTPVYDVSGWSWQEPETVFADPPFTIPAHGGFSFTCEWMNGSDQQVGFGESANDEMCFFWAYYYPAVPNAPHVCIHTDQVAGGFDLCCPGNPICNQIVGAL
ncbi:MAG: hypothetical protein U0234_25470 [Sandaracinus sp.]